MTASNSSPNSKPMRAHLLPSPWKLLFALPLLITSSPLHAQDAPNVDTAAIIQSLRQLHDQTVLKNKSEKQKLIQEINAAATSGESAVATWEKAVMATQFNGINKEVTAFRAWRDGEGESLKEPEAKNAARLYFLWLGLSLQRASGVPIKDLLPSILNYTKDLANDIVAIDALEESLRRDKEHPENKRLTPRKANDHEVKRMHHSILEKPLSGSVVVQWLKLGELLTLEKWEDIPGNFEGIYEKIVQPELIAQRDPRITDYWDFRIKRETEEAAHSKLEFDRDKFNTQRLPSLLWKRATDLANIGYKNRATTEMFAIVRKYPSHPNATEWMTKLESLLLPPPPSLATPTTSANSSGTR